MKRFLIPLAVALTAIPAIAQQDTAPAIEPRERPPIHFQVIKSWKADLGDHAIFLNQVAPPVLPPALAAVPQTNPQPTGGMIRASPRAAKQSELLFLSATVRDRRFTEIRWTEDGRSRSAFSNIDFNLLTGSVTFETAGTVYSLMLSVMNVPTDASAATAGNAPAAPAAPSAGRPQAARWQIPRLDQLSPAHAQYLYVLDESGLAPQEKQLAALDALHLYFDANRQRLADEYAKREAARIVEEQQPKVPPQPKPDTMVNFWPGPGTVILDAKPKKEQP